MTADPDPLDPFKEVHDCFDLLGIRHALIGGWAAVTWGVIRTTRDIDLLADIPPGLRKHTLQSLKDSGLRAAWITGGPDDPIPELLRLESGRDLGTPIDVIIASRAFDFEALRRAKKVPLGSWEAPIVSPEDLIAMKLNAGGGVDFQDAKGILEVQGKKLNLRLLREACSSLKVLDLLDLIRKGQ